MIVGYARVSTDGQSVEAQTATLAAHGCQRIFSETASGAKSDREALALAIESLGKGDVLVITRLDRLARSTLDLLTVLRAIEDRKAAFRSLADPWADTTTPHGRLMVTVLGGLAEFERSLILARTAEGRDRAAARGVRMGRKPKLSAFQVAEVKRRRAAGESTRDLARSYGVHYATISRIKD